MRFSQTFVVLSIAVSALASPHLARGVHHRDVAHRAAMPVAEPEPVVILPKKIKKRADTNRCKVRSSSVAATSTAIIPPQNAAGEPTTTKEAEPTTTKAAEPTTTEKPQTTEKPTTTKKTTTAKPTTTKSSGGGSGNDPLGILDGPHSGDGTFYATGLGSCGITNSDSDFIVAVSHELYDNFPGYNGANPNNNPLCGRMIKATYQGKSVTVKAVDRCTGCQPFDLDFSPSAFNQLADFALGRIHGVQWNWV